MLHTHSGNDLVDAPMYIYLHDTCLVNYLFTKFYASLDATLGQYVAYVTPPPSSNIMAFRKTLVGMYGAKYNGNLTKQRAIELEYANDVVQGVSPEKILTADKRFEDSSEYDVYHTGYPRLMTFYPKMGIFKFSLLNRHGDFQNTVLPTYLSII